MKPANESIASTRSRLSREEEAQLALNQTKFRSGTKWVLIWMFVGIIFAVPASQLFLEFLERPEGSITWSLFCSLMPRPDAVLKAKNAIDLFNAFPTAGAIKAAETKLEETSTLSGWCLPLVQSALTDLFQTGNKEVCVGKSGWLFYRPDIDYVTGPPFLDPATLERRRRQPGIQPDPILAICQFRDQLAERNIDLLILPIPVKPCIEPDRLSASASAKEALQNPSFAEFSGRLKRAGVHVLDLTPDLIAAKGSRGEVSAYLETDTHWRPESVELAARRVATVCGSLPKITGVSLQAVEKTVTNLGDTFSLLKLPASQTFYRPERVSIGMITYYNKLWRPDQNADVLLLGDSFSNIYSLEAMGWGESGGFGEHLSKALNGRPVDCILRNSDGAFATREVLSHELARGNDRLRGKKVVIWEFAARELAFGNWKLIDMKVGTPATTRFLALKPGEDVIVTGMVQAISEVPLPGRSPYKDHIATIELGELSSAEPLVAGSTNALVYLWSMRDNTWTRAARLRQGDRIRVRLFAWDDYSATYEKFNRSELADANLQLQEPVWGELIE